MGIIGTNPEEWKRLEAGVSEINRKRGAIIALFLEIEDTLEGVLSSYLMKEASSEKREFFEVEIMRSKGFEEKVQIFEKVCKKDSFDSETLSRTLNAIKSVQKLRNRVAHWRNFSILETGEIFLRKKNEIKTEKMLSLSAGILKEMEENTVIAKQGIIAFHHWHYTRK